MIEPVAARVTCFHNKCRRRKNSQINEPGYNVRQIKWNDTHRLAVWHWQRMQQRCWCPQTIINFCSSCSPLGFYRKYNGLHILSGYAMRVYLVCQALGKRHRLLIVYGNGKCEVVRASESSSSGALTTHVSQCDMFVILYIKYARLSLAICVFLQNTASAD